MLNFINKYICNYKKQILIYLLLSILVNLMSLCLPLALSKFLDKMIANPSMEVLIQFLINLCLLNLINFFADYFVMNIFAKLQSSLNYMIRIDLLVHLKRMSLMFFNTKDFALLNEQINMDIKKIVDFYLSSIAYVLIHVITIIFITVILLNYNFLFLLIIIMLIVFYSIGYFYFNKRIERKQFEFISSECDYNAVLYNQIRHIKMSKLLEIELLEKRQMEYTFLKKLSASINLVRLNFAYITYEKVIFFICQVIIFSLGSILMMRNEVSIGVFTIFLSYFNLLYNSCKYFFDLAKECTESNVGYNRLKEIFDQKEEKYGEIQMDCISDIVIENLKFSYVENEKLLLDISYLHFEKGIYVIKGSNGVGKSTFFDLLLGFYLDKYKGKILFNGLELKEHDINELRKKKIGYVPQEAFIIDDNMEYNIKLDNNVESEKYISYIKIFGLNKIQKLDKCSNLSGGEKQKISLIRILINNYDILLLDEPTIGLDHNAICIMKNILKSYAKEKIIIVITHDNSFDEYSIINL